jgi:hypothetical protein
MKTNSTFKMPRDLKRLVCLEKNAGKKSVLKDLFINATISFEEAKKKTFKAREESSE